MRLSNKFAAFVKVNHNLNAFCHLSAWTRLRSVNSWSSTKAWSTWILKSSLEMRQNWQEIQSYINSKDVTVTSGEKTRFVFPSFELNYINFERKDRISLKTYATKNLLPSTVIKLVAFAVWMELRLWSSSQTSPVGIKSHGGITSGISVRV